MSYFRFLFVVLIIAASIFPDPAFADEDEATIRLIKAVRRGTLEEVKTLLVELNIADASQPIQENGNTLLHHAVKNEDDLRMVPFIVEFGADTNALDYRGRPAIHVAVDHDIVSAIEYLFELGDSHLIVQRSGFSTLTYCEGVLRGTSDWTSCLRLIELHQARVGAETRTDD